MAVECSALSINDCPRWEPSGLDEFHPDLTWNPEWWASQVVGEFTLF